MIRTWNGEQCNCGFCHTCVLQECKVIFMYLCHTLDSFLSCSTSYLLHSHMSYYCRPIAPVTNVICFIDETELKSFFILFLKLWVSNFKDYFPKKSPILLLGYVRKWVMDFINGKPVFFLFLFICLFFTCSMACDLLFVIIFCHNISGT